MNDGTYVYVWALCKKSKKCLTLYTLWLLFTQLALLIHKAICMKIFLYKKVYNIYLR